MSDAAVTVLVAFIASLPGLLALFGQLKKDNSTARQTDADKDRIELEITEKIMGMTRAEIGRMEKRVDEVEERFNSLLRGAWALHAQVKKLGGVPEYTPPQKYDTGPMK